MNYQSDLLNLRLINTADDLHDLQRLAALDGRRLFHFAAELRIAMESIPQSDLSYFERTGFFFSPWLEPQPDALCEIAIKKKVPVSYIILKLNAINMTLFDILANRGYEYAYRRISLQDIRYKALRLFGLGFLSRELGNRETIKQRHETDCPINKVAKKQLSISSFTSEKELFNRIKASCNENNIPLSLIPKIMMSLIMFIKTSHFRPLLLVGSPGVGKTYLASVISDVLGLPMYKISAQCATAGRGLVGDGKTYRCSGPGEIAQALNVTQCSNPVILIDEIDKACTRQDLIHPLVDELLPALDGSRAIHDQFYEKDISTKDMVFILTANEDRMIPPWLKDRCVILKFPNPDKQRISAILDSYLSERLKTSPYNGRIIISDEVITFLIDRMMELRYTSLRQYISTVDEVMDVAYYSLLREGLESREVVNEDIESALDKRSSNVTRSIGFL